MNPFDKVRAPFTLDQVQSLNAFQHAIPYHPFTHENSVMPDHFDDIQVATEAGWICPNCGMLEPVQVWAWKYMADWSWREGMVT